MKVKNLFYITIIIFLTSYGCGGEQTVKTGNSGIKIRLSGDSSKVELYNISLNIFEELRSDSLGFDQWKDFFAVYQDTSDKEMRDFQPAMEGTYTIKKGIVQFAPTVRFRKGGAYFSRCYIKDVLEEAQDIISNRDLSPTDGYLEYSFSIK